MENGTSDILEVLKENRKNLPDINQKILSLQELIENKYWKHVTRQSTKRSD